MAAALSTVRGAFAGLSPREKRLLIALAAVFMLLGFLGFYLGLGLLFVLLFPEILRHGPTEPAVGQAGS